MFTTKRSIVNLLLRFRSVLALQCCIPLFVSSYFLLSFHGRKSIQINLIVTFPPTFGYCTAQQLPGIFILTVNGLIDPLSHSRLLFRVLGMLLFLLSFHACLSKLKQIAHHHAIYIKRSMKKS